MGTRRNKLNVFQRIMLVFIAVLLVPIVHIDTVSASDTDLRNVYACLTAAGLSDIAAAAIVGNAAGESGGSPSAAEHNNAHTGKGIGIFQWSNDGNRDGLVTYCAKPEHASHEKVSIKPDVGGPYLVCNRADCQVAYLLIDVASRLNGFKWSKNYNTQVASLSNLKTAAQAGKIPASLNITNSYDGFKAQTSLEAATVQFLCDYETPGSTSCFWVGNGSYSSSTTIQDRFISSYTTRFTAAKKAYDNYAGSVYTPQPGSAGDFATGVGAQLYGAGFLSESELASYCKLTEINLEDVLLAAANAQNLSQKDLESLTDWERNHRMEAEEHGYIAILRKAVILVGIIMTIWAVFIYLAFWFDHINSLFYLDALHILTLGQLHICPPGDKPTFSLGKKVKTRTVSHAQIIGICAIAVLFGSLLISGVFYTIVSKFVNLVMGVFR